MFTPANVPLRGDRFHLLDPVIPVIGADLTGADFKLQVRDRKDGGALRADLGTVATAAAEGVRLISVTTSSVADHLAAGRLVAVPAGMTLADVVTVSLIGIRVNKSTMEAMPYPPERGADHTIFWGLRVTVDGTPRLWLRGPFTIEAGAVE